MIAFPIPLLPALRIVWPQAPLQLELYLTLYILGAEYIAWLRMTLEDVGCLLVYGQENEYSLIIYSAIQ